MLSGFDAQVGAGHKGERAMLQASLMRGAVSLTSAALGGYGVFSLIYSFSAPEMAGPALALLGAALALSYFSVRQ